MLCRRRRRRRGEGEAGGLPLSSLSTTIPTEVETLISIPSNLWDKQGNIYPLSCVHPLGCETPLKFTRH